MIRYIYDEIAVLDRRELEAASCECYWDLIEFIADYSIMPLRGRDSVPPR